MAGIEGPPVPQDGGKRSQFAFLFAVLWLALFVTAMITGIYTFGFLNNKQLDDAIYATLQLFYLKAEKPEHGRILYDVARFSAALLFFFSILALGIRLFIGRFWSAVLRYWVSHHVVVIGLGKHGMRFVELYRQAGKRVVVIESDPDNPHLPAANDLGAYIVLGDATERSRLIAAKCHRAERVLVQTSTDTTDIAIVAKMERLLQEEKYKPFQKIPVAVMLSDTGLLRGLQLAALKRKAFPLERSHFSVRDLTAREIVRQRRFAEGLTHPEPRVLLFGYGALGEELLEALASVWNPVDGKKLAVTVIAPNADAVVKRDLTTLPYLSSHLSITAINHDWETVGLDTKDSDPIQQACRTATVAVVLEEDREAGLRLGIEANNLKHRVGQHFPVFCLFDADLAGELDEATDPNGILPFDVRSQVLTRQNLEAGQLIEKVATCMCRNWTAAHKPVKPQRRHWFVRFFRGAPAERRALFPAGEWSQLTESERLVWRRRAEQFVGCLEKAGFRVQRRQLANPIRCFDDETAAKLAEAVGIATGQTLPENWQSPKSRTDSVGILGEVRQWPELLLNVGFEVVEVSKSAPSRGKTTYTLYPATPSSTA